MIKKIFPILLVSVTISCTSNRENNIENIAVLKYCGGYWIGDMLEFKGPDKFCTVRNDTLFKGDSAAAVILSIKAREVQIKSLVNEDTGEYCR